MFLLRVLFSKRLSFFESAGIAAVVLLPWREHPWWKAGIFLFVVIIQGIVEAFFLKPSKGSREEF